MEELNNKTPEELQQKLLELRNEQFKARMQHGSGQLSNTAMLRLLRRDIARIKTLQARLRQRAAGGRADGEQA